MRIRTLAVSLLCASVPLAGCSGGSGGSGSTTGGSTPGGAQPPATSVSPPAAAPVLPAGYQQVGGPTNGFTVGIPKGWNTIDLASATARADFKKAGVDPKTADQSIRTLSQNNALFAVDPETSQTNQFVSNLNGFCVAGQPGSAEAIKTQFGRIGAKNVAVENVTLNGQAAVKVTYTHPVGALDTVGLQYQVAAPAGKTCIVTMTAKKGPATPFEKIATTIHTL